MQEKPIKSVDVNNILRLNQQGYIHNKLFVRLVFDRSHIDGHPFEDIFDLKKELHPKFNQYKLNSYIEFKDYLRENNISCEIINSESTEVIINQQNYLLDSSILNLLQPKMSFSFFRKKVEKFAFNLPPCDKKILFTLSPGEKKLDKYFSKKYASSYFNTRNNLFGENYSTNFSFFLNLGKLHPKEILYKLKDYEIQNGVNKSTNWIRVELLWREYFYWLWRLHQDEFTLSKGLKGGSKHLEPININSYLKKMNINPLIKAMNIELMYLGTLSNRARQIYASFLVHKTDLDWRYGAWFFQLYLRDFDFCSNWGNWLYLSGFGTDSRGPRFFNITKQMKMYDPSLSYLNYFNPISGDKWEQIRND